MSTSANEELDNELYFNHMRQELDQVRDDVKAIKDALLGNEYYQKKGMVHKLEEFETRLVKLEDKWNRIIWIITGLAVGSGAGISALIMDIVEKIVKSK